MIKQDYTEEDIKRYLDFCNEEHPEVFRGEYFNIKEKVLEMLKEASKITALSLHGLLMGLDFAPTDKSVEKLESLLAELRSVFWLRNFMFSKIVPIRKYKKQRKADIFAQYQSRSVAIEVFCLTETHEQREDPEIGGFIDCNSKFTEDFIVKANKKKAQLDEGKKDIEILLCVVNSFPIKTLKVKSNFVSFLEDVHKELNWGKSYYVGILTGMVDGFSKLPDDCIYPDLPTD